MNNDRGGQDIVYLDPKTLIPYDNNVKRHPRKHIEALKALMLRHGFSKGNPIQVDRNMIIIAGHGRTEAACELEMPVVPVVIRTDLSDEEVKRWRLEENKSVSNDYDVVGMKAEIAELLELDGPLIGFDDKEWAVLTEDLTADFDADTMIADLEAEMESASRHHEETTEKARSEQVAITDLLGFRHVPAGQQRKIVKFVARLEAETGKTGAEAFLAHVDQSEGAA